jgi:hypothetical protein
MKRRALLSRGCEAGLGALALAASRPQPLSAQTAVPAISEALEQRLADIIAQYDAQGNHRTGSDADALSARWLLELTRAAGAPAMLEPFAIERVVPKACFVQIAGRRIDGLPMFDAGFTGAAGVRGSLGPFGSDAEIGIVDVAPWFGAAPLTRAQPGSTLADPLAAARRSGHAAVIVVAQGTNVPGLTVVNAVGFNRPNGPPLLQVSSSELAWLKTQAAARAEATVVAHVERASTQAFNVVAKIPGTQPGLAPLVILTPRSGWWQCASERGGGLACWFETLRVIAAGKPIRDAYFAALSGHELGGLGFAAYLQKRPDLIARSQLSIFFGESIGGANQKNEVHASDAAFEEWAVRLMSAAGLNIDGKEPPGTAPRGEAGTIHRAGGRFVSLTCTSDVFHNPADRWPQSTDISSVARFASAFAGGALGLATSNDSV